MNLIFDAAKVDCAQAVEGDICQVTFDASQNDDAENNRESAYLCISRNFEFPGGPTIEWHDGENYSGGGKITVLNLKKRGLELRTDHPSSFLITFILQDAEFDELKRYLDIIMQEDDLLEEY